MKLLITLLATALSTGLFAVVRANMILCRITVDTKAKNSILSVPLHNLNAANNDVSLSKVMLTDNLEVGTRLIATHNGNTYGWLLQSGEGETKSWQPINVVSAKAFMSLSDGEQDLSRGVVFWIERAGEDFSKPFYIYGEWTSLQGNEDFLTQSLEITTSEDTPTMTLVSNPLPRNVNLNDADDVTWTNVQNGDELYWSMPSSESSFGYRRFEYASTSGKWRERKMLENGKPGWNFDCTIPAGQGFWYSTKSTTSGDRKVVFKPNDNEKHNN